MKKALMLAFLLLGTNQSLAEIKFLQPPAPGEAPQFPQSSKKLDPPRNDSDETLRGCRACQEKFTDCYAACPHDVGNKTDMLCFNKCDFQNSCIRECPQQ
jgi:hypothetical protein